LPNYFTEVNRVAWSASRTPGYRCKSFATAPSHPVSGRVNRSTVVVRDLAPKESLLMRRCAAAVTQAPWSVAIHLCQSYEEA